MFNYPYGDSQQINLNWIINEIIQLHKQLDPDYEVPTFTQIYPFSETQQLNLDWILTELKTLKELAPEEDAALLKMVANALIANTYDTETAYNDGDVVYRDDEKRLYMYHVAWDSNYWTEIKVGEELTALFNKFNYMYEVPTAVSFDAAVTGKFVSYPDGVVYDSTDYQVLRHVILKQGETLDVTTYATATVAPISLEIHTNVVEPLAQGNGSIETFTYTAKNDCQITICTNTVNPYSAVITGNITKLFAAIGVGATSDDVSNESGVAGATVTDALDNLNAGITSVVEVTDTQPTSGYNEIWIPQTATPPVEVPTMAEFNASLDPEAENLSAELTITTGAKGSLYKKGFLYRVDVGIATRTEFTPASNSLVTLVNLPSSARLTQAVYVPAVYRSSNSDPLTATYAAIYANGNVAIFVNTTSPIYLAMVAIGFTYFKF